MLERYIQDNFYGAPDVLYKYRSWNDENHRDILLNKRLYYSNADSFNDPFDVNIRISYQSLTKEELFQMIRTILKKKEPHLSFAELNKTARRLVASTSIDTIIEHEKTQLSVIRKMHGIICLCSDNKSILMWSYYGNSHRGFIIGFNTKKMFLANAGMLAEVNYTDEYPVIIPNKGLDVMDHIVPQLVHKSKVWSHEGEYRFIKHKKSDFFEFAPEDVEEIILGANISKTDEQEIMSICKEQYPNTKIYKTSLHSTKFELQLLELNP